MKDWACNFIRQLKRIILQGRCLGSLRAAQCTAYLFTSFPGCACIILLLLLLLHQERRSAELESQLAELQQQLEAAQSSRSVTPEALDQARSLFRRKMEGAAREVAELTQRVALAAG
jgi:hypothetical protein